jgi:hexokinase
MKVYQDNLKKFVDSLTPEQQMILGSHLGTDVSTNTWQNVRKLNELLLEKLRARTDGENKVIAQRSQDLFSDRVG